MKQYKIQKRKCDICRVQFGMKEVPVSPEGECLSGLSEKELQKVYSCWTKKSLKTIIKELKLESQSFKYGANIELVPLIYRLECILRIN